MHELSIAKNIVGIAEEEVRKANAKSVKAIELDIGKLAGIDLHALDFVWELAVKKTVLQHAAKIIHVRPGIGYCDHCEREFEVDQLFDQCPVCGWYSDLKGGTELRIKSLTLTT